MKRESPAVSEKTTQWDVESALEDLGLSFEELESITESLREWITLRVIRPLREFVENVEVSQS